MNAGSLLRDIGRHGKPLCPILQGGPSCPRGKEVGSEARLLHLDLLLFDVLFQLSRSVVLVMHYHTPQYSLTITQDRTNLNNAYVSGMREELSFKGNQLNQINTVFTVGYTIGQVPCNIALYYVKPRVFFPSCMASTSNSVCEGLSLMHCR